VQGSSERTFPENVRIMNWPSARLTGAFGLVVRIAWTVACLAALIDALRGYQGGADWKMEENLGFEMIVLGFPGSLVVAVCLAFVGHILGFVRMALPPPSRAEMIGTWTIFLSTGYLQWFVLLPRLLRRHRN
jgi:hypothetical protein